MPEIAEKLAADLRGQFNVMYDIAGSIGKRYRRRQDEAGTPFCLTIDGQTLEDKTCTVRDRDSLEQTRVPLSGVAAWLGAAIGAAGAGS